MLQQLLLILALLQGSNPAAARLQRAKQDFESGRYSEAKAELEEALKLAPQDAALWSYLGLTDYKLKNSEAAIADFEKARALDPRNALNDFNLGMLHHERGETAEALEAYRRGLALSPDDAAANESYARLLLEAHRYREAIAPLQKLRKDLPSNFSLRLGLVESYLNVGLDNQAGEEIQEFVKAPDCSIQDQLALAKLLDEKKRADAARWVLEEAVQAAPNLAEARAGLGVVFTEMGQYQEATPQLLRAVQLAPGSAEYAMRYAEALLLAKQYPAALDFLKGVKDKFGSLPEYRYKLGLAYYGLSQYVSAINELEGLVQGYPQLDRAQYYLGHSYSASGDLQKAEIHYRKALALNPHEASYYAALGHVLRRGEQARVDEAIEYLEKASQLDPNDFLSKLDLALCFEKKNRYTEAERLLTQMVREQPRLLSAHRVLARVYYRQGKKDLGDRESALVAKLDSEQLGRGTQKLDSFAPSTPQPREPR